MSSISAVWNRFKEPPAQSLQELVVAAQSMYGAGHGSSWSDSHIAVGSSLSNTLPEDQFDSQPLWSADRASCLVADVRLDNRAELARALNLVHPEKLADSSFLMAAWLRWGTACVDHILGAFAFAVWTPARQELFAARDHTGERPLFYHRAERFFALASMPCGLLALPGVSRGFEETYVADWLALAPPDRTKSFFTGIERLPPGYLLRVTPGNFECRQYWHPANAKPTRYRRDEDYAEALLEILDCATDARLRTTKSVGSFLSAGLDSSTVTASAARLLAAQGKTLTAFTAVPRPDFDNIGRPGNLPNEGPAAAEVARLYPNIQHVLVDSTGYDLVANMKSWIDATDEPAMNVVNFLWYQATLDQARQRGIDVILEGNAGNGTISWESPAILPYFFRRGRWIKLLRTAHSLRKHGATSIRAATRATFAGILPMWCILKLVPSVYLRNLYRPLATPDLMQRHALNEKILRDTIGNPDNLTAEHSLYYELMDLGSIQAAAKARSGVEFRDPTADKRVYDFCFSIPPEQFVADGHSRSLIRRAMKDRLPESTRFRYARGRQSADWYLSMQEALPSLRAELSLLEQSPAARRTLDLPRMQTLLDSWPGSGYEKIEVSGVWHNPLIRAFSMGYFLRSNEAAVAPSASDSPAAPAPPTAAVLN